MEEGLEQRDRSRALLQRLQSTILMFLLDWFVKATLVSAMLISMVGGRHQTCRRLWILFMQTMMICMMVFQEWP